MNDLRVSFPAPCTEEWEDMAPRQCGRFCDRCDKVILDLADLTADQVDAVFRSRSQVCVRAQVGSDGVLKLKPDGKRSGRRMVTAIGASVGLLTMNGHALAADKESRGAIAGEVLGSCAGSVTATAADGRAYGAKIGSNSRYKVKRLPDGSYDVKFHSGCGGKPWSGGQVIVENRKATVLNTTDPNGYILIGMLKVEDTNG
jgi:hypothetical protein